MPAFSTSSSKTTGVLQMTVASAISRARTCPPESSVMRLSMSIGSPVNWLANSMASATRWPASLLLSRTRQCVVKTRARAVRQNVVCCVIRAMGFRAGL